MTDRVYSWPGTGPTDFSGDVTVDAGAISVTGGVTSQGDLTLSDGAAFTTTLQCITPTAARTISLPDATGTVGLIGGSSGNLVWNNAGAYAGVTNSTADTSGNITLGARLINSVANAASAPPVSLTGSWTVTSGTATTWKPALLVEPSGATSTAWSTGGTGLGVNAASGFTTGRLLDLQTNGTPRWNVTGAGTVVFTQGAPAAVDTSATITIANILTGIITSSTAAAVTMTLPTGTLMDGGFTSPFNDMGVLWSVINTGATNAVTVAVGTNHTIVGSATVSASTSGRFVSRRTTTTTWVTYRVS